MASRLAVALTPVLLLLLWPAGVVLLWLLPDWRPRDKVIGTFVLPGGLFAAWYIATGVRTGCTSAGIGCQVPLAYQLTHPSPSWAFNHVFGPLLLVTLALLPLLAAIYLEVKLFWHSKGAAAGPGSAR
jgi:hypothetical protein